MSRKKKSKKEVILELWDERDSTDTFVDQVYETREKLKEHYKSVPTNPALAKSLFQYGALDPAPTLPREFIYSDGFKKHVIKCYKHQDVKRNKLSLPAKVGYWLSAIVVYRLTDGVEEESDLLQLPMETFGSEITQTFIAADADPRPSLEKMMPLVPVDRLIELHFESLVSTLREADAIDEHTCNRILDFHRVHGFDFFEKQKDEYWKNYGLNQVMREAGYKNYGETDLSWIKGKILNFGLILALGFPIFYGLLWVATPYSSYCQNAKDRLWYLTENPDIDKMAETARRFASPDLSQKDVEEAIREGLMPDQERKRLQDIINRECSKSFSDVMSSFTG